MTHGPTKEFMAMAAQHPGPGEANNDQVAHERGYSAFLRLFKIGTVVAAILTAVVVYVLAA